MRVPLFSGREPDGRLLRQPFTQQLLRRRGRRAWNFTRSPRALAIAISGDTLVYLFGLSCANTPTARHTIHSDRVGWRERSPRITGL